MRIAALVLSLSIVLCSAPGLAAGDYPDRPVKVVITFTEGSATDFVGRTLSQKLSEIWGQPVTAENHAGAGGTIGAALVAEAPADGHTLLVHSSGYVVNPALVADLAYEPLKAFVDIAPIASQPMALVVAPGSALRSVSDLIAAAKAGAGTVKFGSPGTGSAAHLAAEKLKSQTGIDVAHVPYKGGPETISATSEGKVAWSFLPLSLALKAVEAGKLRAVATTSGERSAAAPKLPTISESGVAGFEDQVWWGVWAPSGIPGAVAAKLEKDIAAALADPATAEALKKRAFEPMGMDSQAFAKFVRREMEAVAKTAADAGLKPE